MIKRELDLKLDGAYKAGYFDGHQDARKYGFPFEFQDYVVFGDSEVEIVVRSPYRE